MNDDIAIPLWRNGTIIAWSYISRQDLPVIASHKWHLVGGYAGRVSGNTTIYLHREILGLPRKKDGDVETDHRDRDHLNNRRNNLRVTTRALNMQNLSKRRGSSKYRGVSWQAKAKRWRVQVGLNRKLYYFGDFSDEDLAGKIALEARRRLHSMCEE